MGGVNIAARKDKEVCLEKTRIELAVIKKTADEAGEFAESVINTVREPLISLDQDLRVVTVSRSFYDFFKVKPADIVGKLIYDLGNKQWDIPRLRELLETILPQKAFFDNFEVEHEFANIGLIKMQEAKADNKMFSTLLVEIEGRVRAMALVHESLHKSADLAHVDLQNYIETMSSQICAQFGAERDIRFLVQGARVDVDLDSAVPCGLILNEMITNSYKHAFPGDKTRTGAGNCEIAISVKHEGKVLILSVADNGVGLPADLDLEKSETLGLRLVQMLSKQINGSIELDRSAGTVFRLKFPVADKIH